MNRPPLPADIAGLSQPAGEAGCYPLVRPRRLRQAAWSRRLVAEHRLSVDDLIWPLFVTEGTGIREPVASMPGVFRHSVDRLAAEAERAAGLGIPVVALFPNTPAERRCAQAREALNPDNLVCRAIRAVKAAVPELGVMCDVALDHYTSHGHDGLLAGTCILNDATVDILAQQAVVQAEAGADIIGPSDMMDGRVGAIRRALEAYGHDRVLIMAYAAKYASAFYGPFRDAVGTNATLIGDKRTYQMDPANGEEALREAALDLAEGADALLVKPGLPYLDVVQRLAANFTAPVFAYQVSGEYAMIEAAAQQGWIDRERAQMESLLAFKRAGARGVLTYFACEVAERLARA